MNLEHEAHRDYFRAVMYTRLAEHLVEKPVVPGVGIEFGGSSNCIIQQMCPGTTWTERAYPEFDISDPRAWEDVDIVIADQVLEHVREPWKAFECAGDSSCRVFIFTVPFLIRLHGCPGDFWRMTAECLRSMAEQAGFTETHIDSWGTPDAVLWLSKHWDTQAIMAHVPEEEWRGALEENNPETPITIWGVARR